MPDELKIENERDGSTPVIVQAEQWEKLLGNGKPPTVLPAAAREAIAKKENRSGGVLGSFHRHFRLGGKGTDRVESPRHVFSRYGVL